ncbi:NusG domain II-containing protein [Clostridium drakei]|uniref:Uncharacterized protein n=1 Tax=Clostridium drakei TaxID=332101 RepID=A0A2U8DXX8_9CLOT|nr:NusG domain II-containing protein [Clostridium drakei]AWI06912.1 hypothetical protein B9W14_21245 [Clostridium drakei]
MKKIDIFIIGIVIFLAAMFGVYSYYRTHVKYSEKKYAQIYVDNKIYKTVQLNDKNYKQTIEVKNEYGYNIVKIENGTVRIIDADCADKMCVKSGTISEVEQSLVCMPHKLIVIIKSDVSK